MHSIRLLSVLALLAASCDKQQPESKAPIEPGHTIQMRAHAKGDSVSALVRANSKSRAVVLDPKGKKLLDEELKSESESEYLETVLAEGAIRPARLRRDYGKVWAKRNGMDEPVAFRNKTVFIERKEGAYRFTFAGGAELTEKEAAPLQQTFNRPTSLDFWKSILPGKPVKVNEKWNVNMEPIAAELSRLSRATSRDPLQIDPRLSTGSGILTRTWQQNGHQFGTVEVRIMFTARPWEVAGHKVIWDPGSLMEFSLKFEGCIDGGSNEHALRVTLFYDTEGKLLQDGEFKGNVFVRIYHEQVERYLAPDDRFGEGN